jgi:ABC-type sugar transport system permease subunit
MFKAMFRFNYFGQASSLAVILFVLTLPIIVANTRRAARGE